MFRTANTFTFKPNQDSLSVLSHRNANPHVVADKHVCSGVSDLQCDSSNVVLQTTSNSMLVVPGKM